MSHSDPAPLDRLVQMLDRACDHSGQNQIVDQVKEGLESLIAEGAILLPESVWDVKESYGRRLVYRSPHHGYEVIAMTWGPGQGTPLHDHAGIWCVDGVVAGTVQVTQYDLISEEADRCRFRRRGTVEAGVGSAGSLIPPFEYHTIANPVTTATSVTLHVYGGHMDHCTIFESLGSGWYRRRAKDLHYS